MDTTSIGCSGIALLLISVVAVGGCAHRIPGPVPSETDRASLRTVGIASGTYLPEASFLVPAKGAGQGALIGGAIGFAAPFQGMAGGGPHAIVIAAAMGVVFAPAGAMIGAASAMPLEEARTSESALRMALAELRIQETLRDRIIAEGKRTAAIRSFRPVDRGPAGPSEKFDYGPLAGEGIDSVLEVQATRLGLQGKAWGSDPPMEFFLEVKLRLVRVRDDVALWTRAVEYRSPARRFSEWADNGGWRL